MKLQTNILLTAFLLVGATSTNAAVSIIDQVEGFLGSNKTQVTTAHNGATQINYDATGIDKLVVVYATESGFNNQSVTTLTMQYNGVAMNQAIFQQTSPIPNPELNDNGAVAIFYIDNPFQGAANFTAGATTTGGGLNGGHISIFGLTGTEDGFGATGGTSGTGGGNVSASLNTTRSASLVIAGIQNSGANNVVGALPDVVGSLTLSQNGFWGSNWGHGGSGYQITAGPNTTATSTFSTGTGTYVDVASVEFLRAIPEPSSTALLGLGGLALILRRRR